MRGVCGGEVEGRPHEVPSLIIGSGCKLWDHSLAQAFGMCTVDGWRTNSKFQHLIHKLFKNTIHQNSDRFNQKALTRVEDTINSINPISACL